MDNPHVVVHKTTLYEKWAVDDSRKKTQVEAFSMVLTEGWEHKIHLFPLRKVGTQHLHAIQMDHFNVGVIDMPRRMTGIIDPLGTQGQQEERDRIRKGITQVCQ